MIVFVDDEKRRASTYAEELNDAGYEIVIITQTDEALEFIENNAERIELLVLDIMMPPGKSLKGVDTQDGLRTGIYFSRVVERKLPNLPIVILTNVRAEDVDEQFPEQFPDKNRYLEKTDYFPVQFLDKVKEFVGAPRPRE
jgi:CheY-like chemotaxis protein